MCSVLLSAWLCHAQGTATFQQLVVTDSLGKPLGGVSVEICNTSASTNPTCNSPASIYSDAALAHPLTCSGPTTCLTTDALGQIPIFFANPGYYCYKATAPYISDTSCHLFVLYSTSASVLGLNNTWTGGNTFNSTVNGSGLKTRTNSVNIVSDCGAVGDGVTDDATAINNCITNNPGKRILAPRTITTCSSASKTAACWNSYYIGSTITIPTGTMFECEGGPAYIYGGVRFLVAPAMSGPAVNVTGAAGNSAAANALFNNGIKNCSFYGQKDWNESSLPTWDLPTAVDSANGSNGIQVSSGYALVEGNAVYGFEGNGIAILGNIGNTADFCRINHNFSFLNRQYGVLYTGNGDSNSCVQNGTITNNNFLGGVAFLNSNGGTVEGTGSHFDSNSAISAGATSNLTSVTCAAGTCVIVAATNVAGVAAGTWVTLAGTSGNDQTCHLSAFTDAKHFSCTSSSVTTTGAVGTVQTAASADVYAYLNSATINGLAIKTGAIATNTAQSVIDINPYHESNSGESHVDGNYLGIGSSGLLYIGTTADAVGSYIYPASGNMNWITGGVKYKTLRDSNALFTLGAGRNSDQCFDFKWTTRDFGTDWWTMGPQCGALTQWIIQDNVNSKRAFINVTSSGNTNLSATKSGGAIGLCTEVDCTVNFGGTPLANVVTSTGAVTAALYNTKTNCGATGASPLACVAAAAGSVTLPAAATTMTINTTAVTANSQIILSRDNSLGSRLSVTCNTQSSLVLGTPYVSARSAGTSFTITIDVAPTTNPLCINYAIVN